MLMLYNCSVFVEFIQAIFPQILCDTLWYVLVNGEDENECEVNSSSYRYIGFYFLVSMMYFNITYKLEMGTAGVYLSSCDPIS